MLFKIAANRKFNWISSSDSKNEILLNELNNKMIDFYSGIESRNKYQQMVDVNDNDISEPGVVTGSFLNYLKKLNAKQILEVGCGSGRIYQFISKELTEINYTGIEVSESIISTNRLKFPGANWLVADAYQIPVPHESVDVCFSFYVLEHLVFPEKALLEMLRVVRKEGYLILIFPDFAASGRFASQNIGFSNGPTSISKLKKGRLTDALVSLYDSRIRLPKALKNATNNVGSFPVNLNPKCLQSDNIKMSPDIDAVYIASKEEVGEWANKKGYKLSYPAGLEGEFFEHAFLSIKKID